jgi:hypothetical protein
LKGRAPLSCIKYPPFTLSFFFISDFLIEILIERLNLRADFLRGTEAIALRDFLRDLERRFGLELRFFDRLLGFLERRFLERRFDFERLFGFLLDLDRLLGFRRDFVLRFFDRLLGFRRDFDRRFLERLLLGFRRDFFERRLRGRPGLFRFLGRPGLLRRFDLDFERRRAIFI